MDPTHVIDIVHILLTWFSSVSFYFFLFFVPSKQMPMARAQHFNEYPNIQNIILCTVSKNRRFSFARIFHISSYIFFFFLKYAFASIFIETITIWFTVD